MELSINQPQETRGGIEVATTAPNANALAPQQQASSLVGLILIGSGVF
jgi:hypothetical protein